MKKVRVGDKFIGEENSCFIIAEAGVNHNGSLDRAKELIIKAAKSGADAIKFQNYKAEKLVTKSAPRFWDWKGEEKKNGTQYDSYSLLDKLPENAYPEMIKCCQENNILFFSTPFDNESADFLDKLNVAAYKIGGNSRSIVWLKRLRLGIHGHFFIFAAAL